MRGQDGLVIQMREGPELIFGDARHVRAKWIAATRVLADPDAEGASYIDVRLPGRPAAGGLPAETVTPVAPAGTAGSPRRPPPRHRPRRPSIPRPSRLAPAAPTDSPATATEERSRRHPAEHRAGPHPRRFHRGGWRLGTSRVTLNPNLSFTQTLEHG